MPDGNVIRGLHHVTAITSGAQANLDFYTSVLGSAWSSVPSTSMHLRHTILRRKRRGKPGSPLTFFLFEDAALGRAGTGMADTTAFTIPEAAFGRA